jgi:hypothetical protein
MKQLYETDFVIYDKANDHVLQDSDGIVWIFGVKKEAEEDCCGNETVVKTTELPTHWQEIILNQINN